MQTLLNTVVWRGIKTEVVVGVALVYSVYSQPPVVYTSGTVCDNDDRSPVKVPRSDCLQFYFHVKCF